MKSTIFSISFLLITISLTAQKNLNLPLKARLDSLYTLDQKYRNLFILKTQGKGDSLAQALNVSVADLDGKIWQLINDTDAKNLIEIEKIIKKYGYPGKSLVGEPSNTAAYFVLQHSGKAKIEEYIPQIEEAAKKDELPFALYAMMLDRLLMYQEKEQIYGTQAYGFRMSNPSGDQTEMKMVIWPIQDPENVNKRRKEAGFDLTVEENAQRLGVEYKVLTLEEIKKVQGK